MECQGKHQFLEKDLEQIITTVMVNFINCRLKRYHIEKLVNSNKISKIKEMTPTKKDLQI
jgi:ABC-type uncharacterized transport system permease subunit